MDKQNGIVVEAGALRGRLHGIPPTSQVRIFVDENGTLHVHLLTPQASKDKPQVLTAK